MTDSISQRIHALIFNGITRASSSATDDRDWIRLSERERIAEAVYAELRAGNIEFRLGPLALLAEVVDGDAPSGRAISPQSASGASGVVGSGSGPAKPAEGECDCGHEGLDEWFHLRPCPVAERRFARRRAEDPAITEDRHCRKCGAAVESVTAEPHTEAPHSSGLYMVAMSIARTLHPCGHGYIQATGAVI